MAPATRALLHRASPSPASSPPPPRPQQRRCSRSPNLLHHGGDDEDDGDNGHNIAAERSEAHPLDQFTTLALSLSTTPDLPQARDLILCFHDGYSPLPETTIHVTHNSVYRSRYPHPGIPARPWGAVRLDTSIRLYHNDWPPDSDDADDFDVDDKGRDSRDSCDQGRRHNLGNSSDARWFSYRVTPVAVTLTILTVVVVAVLVCTAAAAAAAVLAANVREPAEIRLPIHLPIVDLLQTFEPLAIRQPSPQVKILAEFIDGAKRVCDQPRIFFRDDEWLESRTAGLATALNATARWRLGQACERVSGDLAVARRGLSEANSAIWSSTTMLLLTAVGLRRTAEGWTSSLEEETLAGFREWVGQLAPEVSLKLDTAGFEAQTGVLDSITSIHTELTAFVVQLRRIGRSVDLDILPLFPPWMVDASDAAAAESRRLLAPMQRGSRERDALEQSVRDMASYVCRLGNALQAVEDMIMVLLVLVVTANPKMATAVATNRHRFSNSSVLDGWNRTIQHLPEAVLSAAYSSRRGCAPSHDPDMMAIHDESAGGRNVGLVEGGGTAATTRRRIVVVPPRATHPGWRGMLDGLRSRFGFRFRFSHPDAEEVSRALSHAIADLKERQARLHDAEQHDMDKGMAEMEERERAREHRVEAFYKALDSAELAADPAGGPGSAGAGWLAGLWSYAGLDKTVTAAETGDDDATAAERGEGRDETESMVEREARLFANEFGWGWRAFPADVRGKMRSEVRDATLLGILVKRKLMELRQQV